MGTKKTGAIVKKFCFAFAFQINISRCCVCVCFVDVVVGDSSVGRCDYLFLLEIAEFIRYLNLFKMHINVISFQFIFGFIHQFSLSLQKLDTAAFENVNSSRVSLCLCFILFVVYT